MAKTAKNSKPSFFKQITQVFKYTYAQDKSLPAILALAFIAPIILFVVLGIVFNWSILTWILFMITAVLLGALCSTFMLTRRADRVGFAQIEGRPGAAISVLTNVSRAGYNFPQEPIWVDPRTKDAIWRGTGYNGIYLIGEGNYSRVKKAMVRQEQNIKGITAGSEIPVYQIIVGKGEGCVALKDLRNTILRCKTRIPTNHRFAFMKIIHPTRRFFLTRSELETLNDRLRTLQAKQGLGIPKGIDPTKPQRVSRRAMRGR
ncbi:MAG: DUF4191 domain-containing protein [Bifidobacteriaceae bacterium]|nr:DUF4191 domain-containing protein [Bifidobacteriaceae bacterium]